MNRRWRNVLLCGALIIVAVVLFNYAHAAPIARCAPHAEMIATLKDQFREEVVGHGVSSAGSILEILASEEGTWTALLTGPEQACIAASGTGWEQMSLERDA